METINYQGQRIEVTEVSEFDGDIQLRPNKYVQGTETLHRTEAGEYYLYRRLAVLDTFTPNERRASGAELVHRLSLTAAALWAASRMTSIQTLDLRRDLNAALKTPASTGATRRFATDSMAATGRFSVELDDLASAMLRRTCREGDDAREAGENPHDLVNAAVTFFLCDGNNNHGDFDLSSGDDALARAKQDRLKAVCDETAFPVVEPDPHPFATPVREITGLDEDGERRFVFTYPPSERKAGRRLVVEVTAKQWDEVKVLAAHFKIRAPFFLRLLVVRQLPDQPTYRHQKLDALEGQMLPEHIGFFCSDRAMARRIERAAQARRQTVDEFIAEMVGSHVDMWEEVMIVHPKTGELLREDNDDLFLIVDDDPLGLDGQSLMQRATYREDAGSTTTSTATVRGLVSPEIFEAAARYTAEHGRTVEEAVAELLKGFAEQAPHAADRRHVGRSEDIALLAAFTPTDEGDESEEEQRLPDDGGEQEKPQEPK